MAKCYNCGAEFEGSYCPDCGVPAPAPAPNQNAYNPPPVYNNINVGNTDVTTVGGWVGWMFLVGFLGIIGLIIMLCASKDESVKNYAKASLILCVIALVIGLLLLALGVFAGMAASN